MNQPINSSSENTTSSAAIATTMGSRSGASWPVILKTSTICLMVTMALVLAACGSKKSKAPTPTQADATPINPENSASDQEKQRIAQAVALRDGIEPAPPAIKLRGGELATPEVLAAYNQELLRYIFREKDIPESIEELSRKRSLPRLPTPPPGKRIVYDGRNHIIRLEPP